MNFRTWGRRLAAAAALAVLTLAPQAQAQAPTPTPTKLEIGIVSRTIFFLPLWIADEQGFLKQAGIDPTITIFDSSDKINAALRSHAMQIAITSGESIIADDYHGGTIRMIAGNAQRLPHFIIAKPAIKTLAGLKGATIGVLSMNDGTTFLLDDIAKAAGLTRADFTIDAVGGAPTRWKLLQAGKIDAGLQPFPLSYEAEAAGFTNLGPVAQYIPNYQFTMIVAESGWAQQHRALVVAFLRALRHGSDTMFADPDAAAAVAAKELHTSVPLARRALADTMRMDIMPRDMALSEPGLREVFHVVQAAGLVGRGEKFDRAKFEDDSYLRESRRPLPR